MNKEKLIKQLIKILRKADLDMDIKGNAYWKFTDRKIELVKPEEVEVDIQSWFRQSGSIIQTAKTNDKLYGKSIL